MESTIVEVDGRQMTFNPSNIDMIDLARRCNKGRTSYVILEPGDRSKYTLYVVPFKNPHLRMPGCDGSYLMLVIPGQGAYPFSINNPPSDGYLVSALRVTEWTGEILATFFRILASHVEAFAKDTDTVED